MDQHACLFVEFDVLGAEEVSDVTKEIRDALLGSARFCLGAAPGAGFTAACAVAVVSCSAAVDSLADGSEDEEEAQVEGEDDCEEGEVGDVLFSKVVRWDSNNQMYSP